MVFWKSLVATIENSAFLFTFAGLLFLSPLAAAQSLPNPPPVVCIEETGKCVESASPTASDMKKWNPGHYVKTQGKWAQADLAGYYSDIHSQLKNHVNSSDVLRGALISYGWGSIEQTQGKYDWSPIYSHLNWLESHGKRMILTIKNKCFGACTHIEPGGLAGQVEDTATGKFVAIWRKPVMDRAILFMRALAEEFDGNPAVELVYWGGESCGSWSGDQPEDYSHELLLAEQIRMYDALADAFSRTNVMIPWNCNAGGTIVQGMEEAYKRALGHASPDTYDDSGNRRFRGEEDAIRDYRGLIPHSTVVSAPDLGGRNDILPLSNVQSLIDKGHMTHVSWVLTSSKTGAEKADIIAHLESVSGTGVYAHCPKQYDGACGY